MTPTATYIAEENCLQELPRFPEPSKIEAFNDFVAWYGHVDMEGAYKKYNKHVDSLRRIPCSPEPGFKDGEKYTEGVDYEIKGAGDWKWCYQLKGNIFAAPIVPVKSEEKTFTLSELKEIIRSRMYAMENGRQPREGCNALFYNLIYFLEHGEEDPNA